MLVIINNVLGNIVEENPFFKSIYIPFTFRSVVMIIVFSICNWGVDELQFRFLEDHESLDGNLFYFCISQVMHLGTILILPVINAWKLNEYLEPVKQLITNPAKFLVSERLLFIVLILILSTSVSGEFIRVFVKRLDNRKGEEHILTSRTIGKDTMIKPRPEIKNGGYTIGILERLLIISAILLSHPALIGYILTGKSIARLRKLDNDKFAEYFLIGNTLSFICAIAGGVLIQYLLSA